MRQSGDKGVVVELPNGELLEIHIDAVIGKRVKLGFVNNESVQIWRGEVWERMVEEGRH